MRRGDDPGVDADRPRAPQPLDLSLLEHAEQLDLHFEGRSPISSRKIVEWSASSKRPICRASAPVKAPFSGRTARFR